MSHFERLDRAASRIVDRVNAIPFVFTPHKATPNGRPVIDPTRPTWTGRGIPSEVTGYGTVEIGARDGAGNSLQSVHMATTHELSVDRHEYPKVDQARQWDKITFDGQDYWVSSVKPEGKGLSRVVLRLSEIR